MYQFLRDSYAARHSHSAEARFFGHISMSYQERRLILANFARKQIRLRPEPDWFLGILQKINPPSAEARLLFGHIGKNQSTFGRSPIDFWAYYKKRIHLRPKPDYISIFKSGPKGHRRLLRKIMTENKQYMLRRRIVSLCRNDTSPCIIIQS